MYIVAHVCSYEITALFLVVQPHLAVSLQTAALTQPRSIRIKSATGVFLIRFFGRSLSIKVTPWKER